jgi:hypothetical protein
MWGALSDERTGLSFTIAAGPRQRSHSQARVPRDLDHILLPPRTTSPRYIAPERTAQKTSLLLLRILSLSRKQGVHRAVS